MALSADQLAKWKAIAAANNSPSSPTSATDAATGAPAANDVALLVDENKTSEQPSSTAIASSSLSSSDAPPSYSDSVEAQPASKPATSVTVEMEMTEVTKPATTKSQAPADNPLVAAMRDLRDELAEASAASGIPIAPDMTSSPYGNQPSYDEWGNVRTTPAKRANNNTNTSGRGSTGRGTTNTGGRLPVQILQDEAAIAAPSSSLCSCLTDDGLPGEGIGEWCCPYRDGCCGPAACEGVVPYFCKGKPMRMYLICTPIHLALQWLWIGFMYALKRTIWLGTGMALGGAFMSLMLMMCWVGCCTESWDRVENYLTFPGVLGVMSLVQASAGFSGCYAGAMLQEYWWINDLPKYDNVNPFSPGTVADDGYFRFMANSHVNTSLAGYYSWRSTGKGARDFTVCAAPVVSPSGIMDYPQNIQFWVLGMDCCSQWGTLYNDCINRYDWQKSGSFVGYTRRLRLNERQAQAPPTIARHYRINITTSTSPRQEVYMMNSDYVKFVEWKTEDVINAENDRNMNIAYGIIIGFAIGWPLFSGPFGLCILCGAKPPGGWCSKPSPW